MIEIRTALKFPSGPQDKDGNRNSYTRLWATTSV